MWITVNLSHLSVIDKQPLLTEQEKNILKGPSVTISGEINTDSTVATKRASTQTSNKARKKQKPSSKIALMYFTKDQDRTKRTEKQQQACLRLAASLFGGEPTKTIQYVSNQLSDSLHDATVKKYTEGFDTENKEDDFTELLFGNKNDIRRLIGLEGKKLLS